MREMALALAWNWRNVALHYKTRKGETTGKPRTLSFSYSLQLVGRYTYLGIKSLTVAVTCLIACSRCTAPRYDSSTLRLSQQPHGNNNNNRSNNSFNDYVYTRPLHFSSSFFRWPCFFRFIDSPNKNYCERLCGQVRVGLNNATIHPAVCTSAPTLFHTWV